MALDDILKGLAIFGQGMKENAIYGAVQEANKQMEQINFQQQQAGPMTPDMEKALGQERSNLAQRLSMRLSGLGASGATISAATGHIAPSATAQAQIDYQERALAQSREQKELDRKQQMDMYALKVGSAQVESAQKARQEQEYSNILGWKQKEGFSVKPEAAEKLREQSGQMSSFIQNLSEYNKILKDAGTEQGPTVDKAKLETAQTMLKSDYALIKGMGAMADFEADMADIVLGDPTSWTSLDVDKIKAKVKTIVQSAANTIGRRMNASGYYMAPDSSLGEALNNFEIKPESFQDTTMLNLTLASGFKDVIPLFQQASGLPEGAPQRQMMTTMSNLIVAGNYKEANQYKEKFKKMMDPENLPKTTLNLMKQTQEETNVESVNRYAAKPSSPMQVSQQKKSEIIAKYNKDADYPTKELHNKANGILSDLERTGDFSKAIKDARHVPGLRRKLLKMKKEFKLVDDESRRNEDEMQRKAGGNR